MAFIAGLVSNKIIVSVLVAYMLSNFIKMFFYYLATEKWDVMVFFRTGGMPSSHTATVTSMTAAIYFSEGISNLFIVTFIISAVIISDAVGIRRAAGKQAAILNKIVEEYRYYRKFRTKRLYELLGHTPKQVLVGLFLGIIIARVVFLF